MRHESYIHDRSLQLFRLGKLNLDECICQAAAELAERERRTFNDNDERPRAPIRRIAGYEGGQHG